MQAQIGRVIDDFEQGRLTRRQLMRHLAALIAVAGGSSGLASARQDADGAARQDSGSTFRAIGLNHIALNVADIPRSRDFYVKHLGLTVTRESSGSCFLRCEDGFLALFRSPDSGMHHYCYAIHDYTVGSAAEKLREQGLEPRISGNRIYFDDPDGLEIQLSAPDHRA
jgi:catechol 2,3-dioxygenase-like lactoylglutathione lyase family enzyme